MMNVPTYRLRFFFDYGCNGCLWSDNEAAYKKYDVGILDAEIYDLNGKLRKEAKIKLPDSIRVRVIEMDKLYSESLDWENPTGPSLWSIEQWNRFYQMTKELHNEISNFLGEDFELVYNQSINKEA